jgi:hypothetical protein
VPDEAVVIRELITSLPLAAGPRSWAQEAAEIMARPRLSREQALQSIEQSSFSMAEGVTSLMKLYSP